MAVSRAGAILGVDIDVFLIDYEQRRLVRLDGAGDVVVHDVDTTVAGQAFRHVAQTPETVDGAPRLWVPLLDGLERLGVLCVRGLEGVDVLDGPLQEELGWLAACFGHIVASKQIYADTVERTRRSRPMSVAAELLWNLLPPLTFGVEGLTISAILEPCYDVGGDCFDYGVAGDRVRFALFDSMGHSLPAGMLSAAALAAYRSCYRAGHDLERTVRAIDETLLEQFAGDRFATAFMGELDLRSGALRYVLAGHPAPLLLRGGRVVESLDGGLRVPLGVQAPHVPPARAQLRSGDRLLLYTDGVTEARDGSGGRFGLDRLLELVESPTLTEQRAPEMLRQLGGAVVDHLAGRFEDDATLLLVEWRTGEEHHLTPMS